MSVPDILNATDIRARLARWLSATAGHEVVVENLRQFPVGFSWLTYGVRIHRAEGPRDEVLRLGPPYGLFAPYSAAPQVLALRAAAKARVPVPEAYEWSDDPTILGAPFFLAERAAGTPPEAWGSGVDGDAAWRTRVGHDFVDALAALHRHDWQGAVPDEWSAGLDIGNTAARQIELCAANYRRWALISYPMMHRALGWLRQRLPVAPRISLVHGDYRIGNFLEKEGRITAILDWELVHLGDPIEDLGWAMLPQFQAGTGLVSALLDEASFIRRYEDKVGFAVEPAALAFYKVLALVKLALTHMAAARCFEDGRFSDMRMPAMTTQIAPVLRQIAKTIQNTPEIEAQR